MPMSSDTGVSRTSDTIAVAIVIPAEGPSFGTAPAGTCRCTSWLANQSSGRPSCSACDAHPRERRLRRLLHHLAELAGDRQLALAGVRLRLDEEDVAAGRGVREARRDAGVGSALAHLAREAARCRATSGRAARRRGAFRSSPSRDLARGLSAEIGDATLEPAHTRLARVLADHEAQRLVGDRDRSAVRPCASICFGTRYRFAMPSFSSSV